jgi:hypothetical protein
MLELANNPITEFVNWIYLELNLFLFLNIIQVAPKAQKKVPVPEGLDLDAWINEPPSESGLKFVFYCIFKIISYFSVYFIDIL